MKKWSFYFGILIVFTVFLSCSKEKDTTDNEERGIATIVGKWKPINDIRVCESGEKEYYPYDECRKESRFKFYSDNKFEWSVYSYSPDGCVELYDYLGTWKKGEDFLNLTSDQGNTVAFYTIVKLVGRDTLLLGNKSDCYCIDGSLRSHNLKELVRIYE